MSPLDRALDMINSADGVSADGAESYDREIRTLGIVATAQALERIANALEKEEQGE